MGFPHRRTANVLFTTLAFAVALGIIYVARTVLVIFAFAILFAYLIDPIVRFLQRHSLLWKRLRGPHVLEAYVVLLVAVALGGHALAPKFLQNARLLGQIPAVAERVSSGEIADDMQDNLGWSDANTDRLKTFLQGHRSDIEKSLASVEGLVSGVAGAILVIPILAIFFLSDGEHLADSAVRLISTHETYASIRSLAGELHIMLQHYIRAKVTLAALSLTYCSIAMLVLGFPNPFALGVLAGVLEFIPVAGWMISAATITTVGILTHSHWIWMLALLGLWRVLMDYLIAPRVMGHELEMHPLLAIFTFMVGGAVDGIVGIYLSVPLVASLRVIYRRYMSSQEQSPQTSSLQLPVQAGANRSGIAAARDEVRAATGASSS